MNAFWALLPVVLPFVAAIACLVLRESSATPRVAFAGAVAACVASLACAARVLAGGPFVVFGGWLHADGLTALVLVVVGVCSLACMAYSLDYMQVLPSIESSAVRWAPGRFKALMLGLIACLTLGAVSNNLGLMWIAIEGATLASALLVGFYRRADALEAAWKYLILCSVGITLALFATVLLYYSAVSTFGESGAGLQWTALRATAATLDPRFVKLAFLFALVGYGAKAGIAPMHSWMPDAYSRSPAPTSALMASALLAVSLGALLRFFAVTRAAVGPAWPEGLFAFFGVLSIVVSVPFLLVQDEFKRLLAWSSLSHTGLVTLALGLGTPLAMFGGLLHLLVGSFAKALAFLLGGTLLRATGSRRMDHWAGMLEADRELGSLLVIAGVAILGLPPAATFLSEWLALTGGFAGPRGTFAVVALFALVVSFCGLAYHWTRMVMGRPRPGFADPLPRRARWPLWALAALLLVLGVWLPAPVRALVDGAMESIQ